MNSSIGSSNFNINDSASNGQITKTFAYCTLFLVSFAGNLFTVRTIYKDNRLKTSTNFLVANMAVSDLFSSFFLLPLRIIETNLNHRWLVSGDIGLALCKLVLFIPDVSTAVSFYSCIFIAVDRLLAITYPVKGGFIRSKLQYIIPGIWTFSVLFVSPYLYYFKLKTSNGVLVCTHHDEKSFIRYVYVLLALNIGIPIPVVTVIYVFIVYKLRRHKIPDQLSDRSKQRRHQKNKKVLKISIVVVSLLYFSWSFLAIFTILNSRQKFAYLKNSTRGNIQFAAQFIAYSSFAYNSFIYLFFNKIYRENFKKLFKRCICT